MTYANTSDRSERVATWQLLLRQFCCLPVILATQIAPTIQSNSCHPPKLRLPPYYKVQPTTAAAVEQRQDFLLREICKIAILMVCNSRHHRPAAAAAKYHPYQIPPLTPTPSPSSYCFTGKYNPLCDNEIIPLSL